MWKWNNDPLIADVLKLLELGNVAVIVALIVGTSRFQRKLCKNETSIRPELHNERKGTEEGCHFPKASCLPEIKD
jgi:hypothetical protein